jgi:hypothetical protein
MDKSAMPSKPCGACSSCRQIDEPRDERMPCEVHGVIDCPSCK